MEGWQIGLVVVLALGIAVIVLGALRDRRLNARRRAEMLAPPQRDIPRFSPDAPTPRYLSELQARRPPAGATPTALDEDERQRLRAWWPTATRVAAGCQGPELVSDPTTGWAVLRDPSVLVTDAELTSVRQLLGVLEHQVPTGRPLVVAAPRIAPELLATFTVNHVQQVITILGLELPDESDRRTVATVTGASPVPASDLQSGFVGPGTLGRCSTWVASRTESRLG